MLSTLQMRTHWRFFYEEVTIVFPPPMIFQIPNIFCSEKNYTTRNNFRQRDILMLLHVPGNLSETILDCILYFS